MGNPQMPQAGNQFVDPTLEPEELQEGGGFVAKKGMQIAEICDVEVDQNFVNSKGVKGWRWCFTWALIEHDKSGSTQSKVWMDNTSAFGASCLHNMFINIGIPYTIPNPNDISKSTGTPRKSFFAAACIRQIDGRISINKETFLGKKALVTNRWAVKCPECGWNQLEGSKMNASRCKNKDMNRCHWSDGEVVQATVGVDKIYNDIDTTSINPPPSTLVNMSPQPNTPEPMPSPEQPEQPVTTEPEQTMPQPQSTAMAAGPTETPIQSPAPETGDAVPESLPGSARSGVTGIYPHAQNAQMLAQLRTKGYIPPTGTIMVADEANGYKYTIVDEVITKVEPTVNQTLTAQTPAQQAPPEQSPQTPVAGPTPPQSTATGPGPEQQTSQEDDDDLPF